MSDNIHASGYYYPNKMGRVFLMALQEALILDGYAELLNWAGLPQYAQSLPPDNWAKGFDFAAIARLNQGLGELYGPRGGQRLALKAGTRFFSCGLEEIGGLAGISDLASRSLPLQTKLKDGLTAVARMFSQASDQITRLEAQSRQFNYHVDRCPICWQRTADRPLCFHTVGFLQETLRWLSDGQNFRVRQTSCVAMGDDSCVYRIDMEPVK